MCCDPRKSGEFSGFYFCLYIYNTYSWRIQQHRNTNGRREQKAPTKPILRAKEPGKGQPSKTKKPVGKNCSIPSKHHRKLWPNPCQQRLSKLPTLPPQSHHSPTSHQAVTKNSKPPIAVVSKSPIGNQDFHLHHARITSLVGLGKTRWGTWIFSLQPESNRVLVFPLHCGGVRGRPGEIQYLRHYPA